MQLKLENGVVVIVSEPVIKEEVKPVPLNAFGKFMLKLQHMQENYKKSFQKKNKPEVVSNAKTAEGIAQDVNKRRSAGSAFRREFDTLFSVRDGLTEENIPNTILAITFVCIAVDAMFYQLDQVTPLPLVISMLPLAGLGLIGYCVKAYLDIVEPRSY